MQGVDKKVEFTLRTLDIKVIQECEYKEIVFWHKGVRFQAKYNEKWVALVHDGKLAYKGSDTSVFRKVVEQIANGKRAD